MGYTTEFYGGFEFNKTVDEKTREFINRFADRRHMKRDVDKIKEVFANWEDFTLNGDLGTDGEYFTGAIGYFGQNMDPSVINGNCPGGECPGLWCQWIIRDNMLVWDGGEKFYKYVEWLRYLIKHFFAPQGYVLNGTVRFNGEDKDDCGIIVIINNVVKKEYFSL